MTNTHHTISYVELGVTDLAVTRAFYEAAFDWKFNDYGGAYAGIKSPDGDGEVGGFNPGSLPGTSGSPLILLFSEDLDATLASVEAAGGTIAAGPYEFPGGRRFEFADPSGNRLGVYAEDLTRVRVR